jgi:hypothetical protein
VAVPLIHPLQLYHGDRFLLLVLLMHILQVSLEQGWLTLLQMHMQQEQALLTSDPCT